MQSIPVERDFGFWLYFLRTGTVNKDTPNEANFFDVKDNGLFLKKDRSKIFFSNLNSRFGFFSTIYGIQVTESRFLNYFQRNRGEVYERIYEKIKKRTKKIKNGIL